MPQLKYQTIGDWKRYGLIYDDYNELYEVYIKTMNCQHCEKEFKNSRDRCMDHDHDTGLFRKIVCRACNTCDSYIKYPNGCDRNTYMKQYYKEHKKEVSKKRAKKTTCLCGLVITNGCILRHLKTQIHLNNMDLYMENVD
jgi:hypothetical protein